MRTSFLAVLLSQGTDVSVEYATEFVGKSLSQKGYSPWKAAIPGQYRGAPKEFLSVEISVEKGFALFHISPSDQAPHWALRLSRGKIPRAVVLYMSPEMDKVPGLGDVFRGGSGDGAMLKIYADHEPWLKVGTGEDPEVAYPVPTIVPERAPTVVAKLQPFLGTLTGPLESALKRGLNQGMPSPESLLQALELPPTFPVPATTLKFIHQDSPLYRNASPSTMGGGLE